MIRALERGSVLTLAVDGPATMAESPAVLAAASERIREGARAVRVDLRDCTTMDSTFSGTLLALKRQLERVAGTLTLVSPSGRVVQQLEQMGLEDFYDVERTEPIDGAWTVVAPVSARTDRLQRIVLDAHSELAGLPGQAGRTFRVVVDELRRGANERSADRAEPPESRRPGAPGRSAVIARLH